MGIGINGVKPRAQLGIITRGHLQCGHDPAVFAPRALDVGALIDAVHDPVGELAQGRGLIDPAFQLPALLGLGRDGIAGDADQVQLSRFHAPTPRPHAVRDQLFIIRRWS